METTNKAPTSNENVVLYGAYLAKQCPHRVARDFDPNYANVVKTPMTAPQQERLEGGVTFEDSIKDELLTSHPTMVCIPSPPSSADDSGTPNPEREKLTSSAMEAGARLIWNGRLPSDINNRRVGEPDLLVRGDIKTNAKWSYIPVDVKSHRVRAAKGTQQAQVSPLTSPTPDRSTTITHVGSTSLDDDLQLAHYARMLDACGHGQDTPVTHAGVIGADRNLWWIDLASPNRRAPAGQGNGKITTLHLYDHEFTTRVAIADAAALRQPTDPHVVELCPQWSQCKVSCPWRELAYQELLDADALVLLNRLRSSQVNKLTSAGVTTRTELANLTPERTAQLAHETGITRLHWYVQSAQAVVKGQPLPRDTFGWFPTYNNNGTWIDIDMENDPKTGIVYMWGVRTPQGYRAFADWSATDDGERDVFIQFWNWLEEQLLTPTTVAYCYTSAEERTLKSLARKHHNHPGVPTIERIMEVIESSQWFDLYDFVNDIAWPLESLSIKDVAKFVGFSWRDDNPSGEESVLWYRQAAGVVPTSPEEQHTSVQRLLRYNEDDVIAMEKIRTFAESALNV